MARRTAAELRVSDYTTISLWVPTAHALRLAAAYRNENMTDLLHRLARDALRSAMRSAGVEYVERPSLQPPHPVPAKAPRVVSVERPDKPRTTKKTPPKRARP